MNLAQQLLHTVLLGLAQEGREGGRVMAGREEMRDEAVRAGREEMRDEGRQAGRVMDIREAGR